MLLISFLFVLLVAVAVIGMYQGVFINNSEVRNDESFTELKIDTEKMVSQCQAGEEVFEIIEEPFVVGRIVYGEMEDESDEQTVEWKVLSWPEKIPGFWKRLNPGDRFCVKRTDKRIKAFHIMAVLK